MPHTTAFARNQWYSQRIFLTCACVGAMRL